MSYLERNLEAMFLGLLEKHGNPKWAREELDWIIFVEQGEIFENLSEHEQWIVRNYLDGLKKVHGGK